MHFNTVDLSGQRYGRLTVLSQAEHIGGCVAWKCQCECGNVCTVKAALLRHGKTRSCGCFQIEGARARRLVHGHTAGRVRSKEFNAWVGMLNRCNNTTDRFYRLYGGRGITVCERWQVFENFFADMGPCPSPQHSIDRKDNNGHYEPGNCRWATAKEQAQNRRGNALYTINGRTQCVAAWAREYGVEDSTVSARLKRGLSIEQALAVTSSRLTQRGGQP